jgi:hypothetical protein
LNKFSWFGYRRVIASAVAVLAVSVGAWWMVRVPPVPVESTFRLRATSLTQRLSAQLPTSNSAVSIVVHVAGEVKNPGVYTLPKVHE